MRLFIPLPKHFDLAANLGYLTRNDKECMYEVDGEMVRRTIVIGETVYLVQIQVTENSQMTVTFLNDIFPKEAWEQKEIIAYIHDWLDLDKDLTPFYTIAKSDPLLGGAVEKSFGLRLIGVPDLFEALCWGVVGQQINLSFAYTLKRRFVEKYGRAVEWSGRKYWIFPSFEQIASLTPEELAGIKMTGRKSEYIIGIAKLMRDGDLSKARLNQMNFRDAEKALMKIRGVGPWTANYVLMRCLRFGSAYPIDDVGLMNAIKTLWNMDRKPTKQEMLDFAVPWKDWEAYATFYLWRTHY